MSAGACLEYGLAATEDEVDVPLNVAALIVVTAGLVEEGVVGAVEGAVVEGHLVAADHGRHGADLRAVRQPRARRILYENQGSSDKIGRMLCRLEMHHLEVKKKG
jgi:hypothetical protein